MELTVTRDVFKLAQVFTISRGSRTEAQVLTVRISQDGVTGWGECVLYARYDETLDSVTAEIEGLPAEFDREALYDLLPAGAARNAVDCALWDLEAKQAGVRAWELAGLTAPGRNVHGAVGTCRADHAERRVGDEGAAMALDVIEHLVQHQLARGAIELVEILHGELTHGASSWSCELFANHDPTRPLCHGPNLGFVYFAGAAGQAPRPWSPDGHD